MKPFVLVAAAAMALASCQKNEMPAPEKQELHFTIKAGIETKTSIADNGDGTYSPSWHKDDKIGILFTEDKTDKLGATFSNVNADGEIASFEGTATVDGEGTLYAFYPASAFDQHYGDETIRLDLPAAQKPTSTSFDPACDILVAKPCDYLADGETVVIDDLYFARLMSVLKINLKGEFAQGEIVESLTFSVDGVDITGNAKVDYKTATIKGWNNGNVDRNVVTASYSEDRYITIAEEGNNAAYLVVAPTTIPAGTSLSFTLKTANYSISKTVSAPSDMTFTAGNLSVINLTINEENCAGIDTSIDYSGEYLIAGKEGDKWYAAKKYTSGNYLSVSEIEFIGENIVETETISDHYMTIEKVADGTYKGMYTIVDAGGKYLSAVNGDDNYLKAVDAVSDNTYWSIEKDEEKGTYSIEASKSSQAEKKHMRFNYNNGTNSRVTCYGSTSTQPYLTLFSTSLVKPDTTPKITVTNTSYSALATDTSVEIPYTVKNITGDITATVASDATMSNVSTNVTADKVTVSFAANEDSAEKTATIVLSYDGAQSVNVVIAQAGKPAEGGEAKVEVWSWDGGGKVNFTGGNIVKTYGLGSDYAASHAPYQIKMDDTGDYFIIKVDGSINSVSVGVKMIGGGTTSTLDVQGSSDGESYSSVEKLTISGSQNAILELQTTKQFDPSYRYLKFHFTKGSNIGVGPISITYTVGSESGGETPETPVEPTLTPRNLTFSAATATATVGQAFTVPTLSGETTGVTYSSSNTAVATVNASTGAVTLVAAGTTIITATAPATDEYEAGTASYTLTVNAAQGGGQQTTTYTFNSKSWGDSTNSWTSGKDGNQLTSGQGVQVTTGVSGANATCKNSFSNVSTVVVKYCTNSSKGAGTIKVTIGSVTKTFTVSTSGGTSLRNATFDFNGATGTPKIEVTCTTNSIYVNAISITHTN